MSITSPPFVEILLLVLKEHFLVDIDSQKMIYDIVH